MKDLLAPYDRFYFCPSCGSVGSVYVDEIFAQPSGVPHYHAHMQCQCGVFVGSYADTFHEAMRLLRAAVVGKCENALDPEYADASGDWKCSWCGYEDDKEPKYCPGCGHRNQFYKE